MALFRFIDDCDGEAPASSPPLSEDSALAGGSPAMPRQRGDLVRRDWRGFLDADTAAQLRAAAASGYAINLDRVTPDAALIDAGSSNAVDSATRGAGLAILAVSLFALVRSR